MRLGHLKFIHQGDHVAAKIGQRIRTGWNAGGAMTSRVKSDEAEFLRQRRRQRVPDLQSGAEGWARIRGGAPASPCTETLRETGPILMLAMESQ